MVLLQAVVQCLEDLQLVAQVRPREEVVLQFVPDLGQRPPLGTVAAKRRIGVGGLLEGVLILILVVVAHKAVLVVEVVVWKRWDQNIGERLVFLYLLGRVFTASSIMQNVPKF